MSGARPWDISQILPKSLSVLQEMIPSAEQEWHQQLPLRLRAELYICGRVTIDIHCEQLQHNWLWNVMALTWSFDAGSCSPRELTYKGESHGSCDGDCLSKET